jgi:exosortase A-associated hydrolase 1
VTEEPVQFESNAKRLYGILHRPTPGIKPEVAVMMVVGGPQTRVGSHRLYVQLARFLCRHGITVFRFDYEGLGDSEGDFVGSRRAEASIHAGMTYLRNNLTNQAKSVIWSLCDGSAPSISYAARSQGAVDGLILCNPYVFSDDQDLSRAVLKHYYLQRLISLDFWIKLFSFRVKFRESGQSLLYTAKRSRSSLKTGAGAEFETRETPLSEFFLDSLIRYSGLVKFILSTDDLAAQKFADFLNAHGEIKQLVADKRLSKIFIDGADHTFTEPGKKAEMFDITLHAIHEITGT